MITAIVQARMSSTRLHAKVLLPLNGVTVLEHTVARVRQAKHIGKVIVATSDRDEDTPIAELCAERDIPVFRGSLSDVLDRIYKAAKQFSAEHICRITADCPLIDPQLIDIVAERYEKGGLDYISTGRISTTYPDGMDTEIFSFAALEEAWENAKLPSEREHVTPYIWKRPEQFSIYEVKSKRDLSHVRLTLDEPQDYELLQRIVADVPELTMENMVAYLESHPEVAALNASVVHEAGYAKSLAEDTRGVTGDA